MEAARGRVPDDLCTPSRAKPVGVWDVIMLFTFYTENQRRSHTVTVQGSFYKLECPLGVELITFATLFFQLSRRITAGKGNKTGLHSAEATSDIQYAAFFFVWSFFFFTTFLVTLTKSKLFLRFVLASDSGSSPFIFRRPNPVVADRQATVLLRPRSISPACSASAEELEA